MSPVAQRWADHKNSLSRFHSLNNSEVRYCLLASYLSHDFNLVIIFLPCQIVDKFPCLLDVIFCSSFTHVCQQKTESLGAHPVPLIRFRQVVCQLPPHFSWSRAPGELKFSFSCYMTATEIFSESANSKWRGGWLFLAQDCTCCMIYC